MSNIGLYVGRFQPFHDGHMSVLRHALNLCDLVIIAVGSAQESRTKHNPFTFEERKYLIQYAVPTERYNDVIIIPLEDRKSPSNDSSWGEYVFERVYECTHRVPTMIFEGKEHERESWYDTLDVSVLQIPRGLNPISATQIRDFILHGNKNEFELHVPYGMWESYGYLRKILKEINYEQKN